jgi:hypothetical protein
MVAFRGAGRDGAGVRAGPGSAPMTAGTNGSPCVFDAESFLDRCDAAFAKAEALLDEENVVEALEVLRRNEAELKLVAAASRAEGRGCAQGSLPQSPPLSGRPLEAGVREAYAGLRSETARLMALSERAGRLSGRCLTTRDRLAEELRRLRTGRSYQHGSTGIGAWFSEEA